MSERVGGMESAAVAGDELGLVKDVAGEGGFELGAAGSGGEGERGVEGVKGEDVAMR